MCFILQSAVGLGWENGRVGRESLFAIDTGGNLREKTKQKQTAKKKTQKSKTKLSTPTINVPLFAFVVTLLNQANNSFKTKLNSFILQTGAKFMRQGLHLIITSCICTKWGDNLLQFIL